jgi:hypothetical protein
MYKLTLTQKAKNLFVRIISKPYRMTSNYKFTIEHLNSMLGQHQNTMDVLGYLASKYNLKVYTEAEAVSEDGYWIKDEYLGIYAVDAGFTKYISLKELSSAVFKADDINDSNEHYNNWQLRCNNTQTTPSVPNL